MRSLVVDRPALKSGVRAAIVITVVFAFADKVIGNPTTALFATFGSFALLVLTQFTGPPRTRLFAYLARVCTGATFYTLGTLCSRSPWLPAAAMAAVGFGVLLSGVFSGYFSAGAAAADGGISLDRCGHNLDRELGVLQSWYSAFGFALITSGALRPPHTPDRQDSRQLLSCVRDAARDRGNGTVNAGVALRLASQHLENLSRRETFLGERADAVRTASENGGTLRKLKVLAL